MPRRQKAPEHHVIVYPVPVPDTLENWATWDTVCVPVPVPLIQYIPNLLKPLRWKGRIIGTDEQQQLFSEIWEDLITRFVIAEPCNQTGEAMRLRQNPANKCQLQQSFDNGASWSLAFDYSLCKNQATEYILQQEINNTFNQWSSTTTNTEINQYAPTETFTSSTGETTERINARKLALCYACKIYIDAYCEAIKKINAEDLTYVNLTTLALSVGAALAAIATAATAGATLPLYLGLSAALLAAGSGAYAALTDAVLNDLDARSQVACLMFNGLKDVEPNITNFSAAVNGTTLTGNAELIRSTLANHISNNTPELENQFNAFINLLGENLRPAELGLLPDCPCGDWCISITGADLQTLFFAAGGLGPQAIWTGTGWARNDAVAPSRITIAIDLEASYNVKKIRVVNSAAITGGADNIKNILSYPAYATMASQPGTADTLFDFGTGTPVATFAIDCITDVIGYTSVPGEVVEVQITGSGTPPIIGTLC